MKSRLATVSVAILTTIGCGGRTGGDEANTGGVSSNAQTGGAYVFTVGGQYPTVGGAYAVAGGASPIGGAYSGFGGAYPASGGTSNIGKPSTGGTMPASTGGTSAASSGLGGTYPTSGGMISVGGSATGKTDAGILTGGVDITGGYYETGSLMGPTGTVADNDGSTITLAKNEMCVTGTAVQVPTTSLDGGLVPDYAGAWGVGFGFNLNQVEGVDGGPAGLQKPADVSNYTSVTVGLNGAAGLNLRILLLVNPAADAGSTATTYYCAALPAAGGTVMLSSFRTNCWDSSTAQVAFDPLTMQPVTFGFQVVTDTGKAYPFNFCVTALRFNSDQ